MDISFLCAKYFLVFDRTAFPIWEGEGAYVMLLGSPIRVFRVRPWARCRLEANHHRAQQAHSLRADHHYLRVNASLYS